MEGASLTSSHQYFPSLIKKRLKELYAFNGNISDSQVVLSKAPGNL